MLFTSVDGEVRVVAAPFCTLTLVPAIVEVRKGDLDMVARFRVGIERHLGFIGPVYLLIAGTSIGEFLFGGKSIMVPDTDYALVQPDVSAVDLLMDMTDMDIINIPFSVGAYEEAPVPLEV